VGFGAKPQGFESERALTYAFVYVCVFLPLGAARLSLEPRTIFVLVPAPEQPCSGPGTVPAFYERSTSRNPATAGQQCQCTCVGNATASLHRLFAAQPAACLPFFMQRRYELLVVKP